MITARLIGSNGKALNINGEGEIAVVIHPHPPVDEKISPLPFRQYFTVDGTTNGSNAMNVNGSVTPVEFYIENTQDYDIYIKYLSIIIGDGGTPALNKFGALTALTNGVSWSWFTQQTGDYELHEGIKTNLEFIRIGSDTAAIGTGADAFLADVSGGGTEKSYLPSIDLSEVFGMMYGFRLTKGTTDKLKFTVNDNLTGLTTFNIIAYGLKI